ncbi:MAG: hypothetical protein OYM47_20175 [Gemmatimonadota bacterium]|nr:hypothetical protein [Gemmatimonadota bacterium]
MDALRLLLTIAISLLGIVGVIWFCRLVVYSVTLARARRWSAAIPVVIALIVFAAIALTLHHFLASEQGP